MDKPKNRTYNRMYVLFFYHFFSFFANLYHQRIPLDFGSLMVFYKYRFEQSDMERMVRNMWEAMWAWIHRWMQ